MFDTLVRTLDFPRWTTICWARQLSRAVFSRAMARRLLLGLRWSLITAAMVVTLVALGYAVENWRGRRSWEIAAKKLSGQGQEFDAAALLPLPVPDEVNFAKTPFASRYFDVPFVVNGPGQKRQPLTIFLAGRGWYPESRGNWVEGSRVDLSPWQEHYHRCAAERMPPQRSANPAIDVLTYLSIDDDDLKELREASHRPAWRFTDGSPSGIGIQTPGVWRLSEVYGYLGLRSLAEVQASRVPEAYENVLLQFRLMRLCRPTPAGGVQARRAPFVFTILGTIWHGLADHAWSMKQLEEYDGFLAEMDFLADYEAMVRFERAVDFKILDTMAASQAPDLFMQVVDSPFQQRDEFKQWQRVYRWMPTGWFEQNKLSIVQLVALPQGERVIDGPAAMERRRRLEAGVKDLNGYDFIAKQLIWYASFDQLQFGYVQTYVDLARVACAMERFRLERGMYPPDPVTNLVPDYLDAFPKDVFSGNPLRWSAPGNGPALLYSIGADGRDDGGKPGRLIEGGDLVWFLPAAVPAQ